MLKNEEMLPLYSEKQISTALLLLRLVFGGFMMAHGYQKLSGFDKMLANFPDPLHLGHNWSLILAMNIEFFGSVLVILGLFTKPAAAPVVFCMAIAVTLVNGGKPILEHELAPLFLTAFIVILLCGPGRYSIDHLIHVKYIAFQNSKEDKSR